MYYYNVLRNVIYINTFSLQKNNISYKIFKYSHTLYIILFSKDVTVITYNNCNLSILWLRVTYPVSNSASQVSVTNVLRVCCSFA